jgi:adenine deaminase
MTETDALALVTLNPAIQLGIDHRTGSLEPGKDADCVIGSGHPLSTDSRAEQTWVDGRRYCDRQADLALRAELEAERDALLAEAEGPDDEEEAEGEETEDEEDEEEPTEPGEPEEAIR